MRDPYAGLMQRLDPISRKQQIPSRPLRCAVLFMVLLCSTAFIIAEELPDFRFRSQDRTVHHLADYRGKPLLLDFWASWCFPCRKSFPELEKIRRAYSDRGLQIVAITMETDDAAVDDFLRRFPTLVTVGRDPSGKAGELFEVKAMPTTFLITPEGTIAARFEGGGKATPEAIRRGVENLLSGHAIPDQGADKRHAGKGKVKAWEREYLADPIMDLDGNPVLASIREHIHSSKEAAAGTGGVAGGGCGCN